MKTITRIDSKKTIHYHYPETEEEKEYAKTVTKREVIIDGEKHILLTNKNEAWKRSIKDMLEF